MRFSGETTHLSFGLYLVRGESVKALAALIQVRRYSNFCDFGCTSFGFPTVVKNVLDTSGGFYHPTFMYYVAYFRVLWAQKCSPCFFRWLSWSP